MATKFCDKSPCPEMARALKLLVVPDSKEVGPLQLIVLPNDRRLPPQQVFFNYCPFCGTRVDLEAVR